jgi:hypothetical protein
LALDYLVEIVEHGVIFGEVMYPTIESKAALYLFKHDRRFKDVRKALSAYEKKVQGKKKKKKEFFD